VCAVAPLLKSRPWTAFNITKYRNTSLVLALN